VSESSDKPISRNPPEAVKLLLRQEVGFGCPLPYCRLPFLSFHHFDPPWHKEHHHRPEGMIALCVQHHEMADRGAFDKARLHALKKSDHSVSDVKAKFEWARSKQLIRLGGLYASPEGTVLLNRWGNFPAVSMSETDEGLMELSLVLQDAKGKRFAEINNNMFQASPPDLFDIDVNAGGTRAKIKVSKSEVILDLCLRRVTIEELEKMMREDWKRWLEFRNERSKGNPLFRTYQAVYERELSPSPRLLGGQPNLFSPTAVLPSETDSLEYLDSTANFVKQFAIRHLIQDDGFINVLDCDRFLTYVNNHKCEANSGVSNGMFGLGFGCILARKGVGTPQ